MPNRVYMAMAFASLVCGGMAASLDAENPKIAWCRYHKDTTERMCVVCFDDMTERLVEVEHQVAALKFRLVRERKRNQPPRYAAGRHSIEAYRFVPIDPGSPAVLAQ